MFWWPVGYGDTYTVQDGDDSRDLRVVVRNSNDTIEVLNIWDEIIPDFNYNESSNTGRYF